MELIGNNEEDKMAAPSVTPAHFQPFTQKMTTKSTGILHLKLLSLGVYITTI